MYRAIIVLSIMFLGALLGPISESTAAGLVSYPLSAGINAGYSAGSPDFSSEKLANLSDPATSNATPVGSWIEFVFPAPKIVTKIKIANGIGDARKFAHNSRIKTLTLEFDGDVKLMLTLPDSPKAKLFPVPSIRTTKVRVVPGEFYPGSESQTPYLSHVRLFGYDPSEKQVVLIGEFKDCKINQEHSEDQALCGYFQAVDGTRYGCSDDLCYHPKNQIGTKVKVTGILGQDNTLKVLYAKPTLK